MVHEKVDRETGAIIFVPDEETLRLRKLEESILNIDKRLVKLEKEISKLKK